MRVWNILITVILEIKLEWTSGWTGQVLRDDAVNLQYSTVAILLEHGKIVTMLADSWDHGKNSSFSTRLCHWRNCKSPYILI